MSEWINVNRSTLYDTLKRLERAGMIKIESTTKYTTITITNWSKWQGQTDDFDQQLPNNFPTTSQQPSQQPISPVKSDTPNNPTNNFPTTSQENDNTYNNNKEKEIIPSKLSNNNLPVVVGDTLPAKKPTPTELGLLEHKVQIDNMVQAFNNYLGLEMKSMPSQRKAALAVIKRMKGRGMDAVTAALDCQDDQYAPRIANLVQLDKKLENLFVYYRGKNGSKNKLKVGVA